MFTSHGLAQNLNPINFASHGDLHAASSVNATSQERANYPNYSYVRDRYLPGKEDMVGQFGPKDNITLPLQFDRSKQRSTMTTPTAGDTRAQGNQMHQVTSPLRSQYGQHIQAAMMNELRDTTKTLGANSESGNNAASRSRQMKLHNSCGFRGHNKRASQNDLDQDKRTLEDREREFEQLFKQLPLEKQE